MFDTMMLAAADTVQTTDDKVDVIYKMIEPLPMSGLETIWLLSIITVFAVVTILIRLKKIAQNQVDLAEIIKQLAKDSK